MGNKSITTKVTSNFISEKTEGLSVNELCGIALVQLGRFVIDNNIKIDCSTILAIDGVEYKTKLKVTATKIKKQS